MDAVSLSDRSQGKLILKHVAMVIIVLLGSNQLFDTQLIWLNEREKKKTSPKM